MTATRVVVTGLGATTPARRRRRHAPGQACSPARPASARSTEDWADDLPVRIAGHGGRRARRGARPGRGAQARPLAAVRADRRPRGVGRRRLAGGRPASASASSIALRHRRRHHAARASTTSCARRARAGSRRTPSRCSCPTARRPCVGLELGARAGVHTPVSAPARPAPRPSRYGARHDPHRPGRRRRRRRHRGRASTRCRIAALRRDAGAVDAQRRARARVAPVRQGPRRLRPRRGRRRPRARVRGARRGPRRARSTPRSPAPASPPTATTSPQPDPEGRGAARAMRCALDDAGARRRPTSCTSTRTPPRPRWATSPRRWPSARALGDARRPRRGRQRTKSMTGHLLGAAGAVESIATVLALHDRVVPADDQPRRPRRRGRPRRRRPATPRPLPRRRHRRAQQLVRLRRPQRRARLPERLT